METTGTLLVGPDIAAAATIVQALDVPLIGLNCATGPQEMAEHLRWLSANWPGLLSVLPNAGLPELVDGQTHYPLRPAEMASWVERFVAEDGVNLIGGCCGTRSTTSRRWTPCCAGAASVRPAPVARHVVWMPSVASLYQQVPLRQENAYLLHRRALQRQRLEEMARAAGGARLGRLRRHGPRTDRRGQQQPRHLHRLRRPRRGGRNGRGDAPLHRQRERAAGDRFSTETPVIESALKLHGGKPIINSINFEDGEATARDRLALAKRFGAAVIALTIDEEGMAKTPERKLAVAERLVDFACNGYGLQHSDLLIDPLTFTIATGNEDDRKLGAWTLEGIQLIRERFPDIQIILGLSNISFGLNAAARVVLNSRLPRSCPARRHDRRDRACLENPAAAPDRPGGSAGRRRPDLRPARARATTRCSACWRSSPIAKPPMPAQETRPTRSRDG